MLWGSNEANDYFLESHGITTPDEFVKLVYSEEERKAIPWQLPNRPIRGPDHHEIGIPDDLPCHSTLPADIVSACSSTVRAAFS